MDSLHALDLLGLNMHLTPRRALTQHLVRHRWLFECRTAAVFLQYARTLVLLLKAAKCAIDRFVFLDYYSYQAKYSF
jgi:hypothetical protein